MRYFRGLYHGLHCCTSAPCRSVLVSDWSIYNCQDWVNFFQVSFIVLIENRNNTHTSTQAYVRQPHPSQTTYQVQYKPHETKRPQPTRLYETKVPCGAAYIIWPRKAVSLNICACQYYTPTKTPFLPTMPRRETKRHTAKLLRTASRYTKDDISQLDHFSFGVSAQGCGNKEGSK